MSCEDGAIGNQPASISVSHDRSRPLERVTSQLCHTSSVKPALSLTSLVALCSSPGTCGIHPGPPVWRQAHCRANRLAGKYDVDLRGNPSLEQEYQDLFHTLHGTRPAAPSVISRLPTATSPAPGPTPPPPFSFDPVRILRVVVDEVSMPRMDGTRGSALYRVPFQLSRRPSAQWVRAFVQAWNHLRRHDVALVADTADSLVRAVSVSRGADDEDVVVLPNSGLHKRREWVRYGGAAGRA